MESKFVSVLKSRKFWAAVVCLLVAFFGSRAGVSPDQLVAAVVVVVGYIVGTALDS